MIPPSKRQATFKDAFAETVALFDSIELPKVTKLRGNESKPVLLIAPSPNDEECKLGLPLSNETYSREFHGVLLQLTGLNTQSDFIVMAGCPIIDTKPSKRHIEPFRNLLLAQHTKFKLVVVIGADNFKFYFGRGKKSSLQTLSSGTPVFLNADWPGLPIFVIPDIKALSPEWTNDKNQDWKLQLDLDRCVKWLRRICPGLAATYKRYVK